MKENYSGIEDLLTDESFIDWVNGKENSQNQEWEHWVKQDHSRSKLVDEAKQFLHLLQAKQIPVNEEQAVRAEKRLRSAIEPGVVSAKVVSIHRKAKWYWAAAAIAVISLSVAVFTFTGEPQQIEMASNYGEVKKNKLPDGTEVILNANSKIILDKKWKSGEDREVWVEGEVFFHVKQTAGLDKFIVHTDAFSIQVTGTSFNVINDNGKSSVVLKEGSITILREGEQARNLKPGDFIEFSDQRLQQKTITKDDFMAWTANKVVFDNTTLTELSAIIKNHYGVEVKLDGNVGTKTLTGIMPNDNLDVLLQSLNALQEFKVIKKEDTIIITGLQ